MAWVVSAFGGGWGDGGGDADDCGGATTHLRFTPRPAGFRWFHTHTFAGGDLKKAQYGGQHGFLMVEPRESAGDYDREVFLALHDWGGRMVGGGDGSMNPEYEVSTINGKMLGFGEPLKVKQGERVLMHVLNSSPTEVHWVSLAGHKFRVTALDGNAVARRSRSRRWRCCGWLRRSGFVLWW